MTETADNVYVKLFGGEPLFTSRLLYEDETIWIGATLLDTGLFFVELVPRVKCTPHVLRHWLKLRDGIDGLVTNILGLSAWMALTKGSRDTKFCLCFGFKAVEEQLGLTLCVRDFNK